MRLHNIKPKENGGKGELYTRSPRLITVKPYISPPTAIKYTPREYTMNNKQQRAFK